MIFILLSSISYSQLIMPSQHYDSEILKPTVSDLELLSGSTGLPLRFFLFTDQTTPLPLTDFLIDNTNYVAREEISPGVYSSPSNRCKVFLVKSCNEPADAAGGSATTDKYISSSGPYEYCEGATLEDIDWSPTTLDPYDDIIEGIDRVFFAVNPDNCPNPTVTSSDILPLSTPLVDGVTYYMVAKNTYLPTGVNYFYENTWDGITYYQPFEITVTVNPNPDLSSGNESIIANDICLGEDNIVNFSSGTLENGTYDVTFNLSGANSANGLTSSMVFNSGTGSFTIGASELVNSGTTSIDITLVSSASTSCSTIVSSGSITTSFEVN